MHHGHLPVERLCARSDRRPWLNCPLEEWNPGTALLVATGWASLAYRIHAEERVLRRDAGWAAYAASVRYRLFPGLW